MPFKVTQKEMRPQGRYYEVYIKLQCQKDEFLEDIINRPAHNKYGEVLQEVAKKILKERKKKSCKK